MKWTRSETLLLLKLYRESPCLNDPSNINFTNKVKRNARLVDIQSTLLVYKPNVTIKDIKAKIKTLQTQHYKERKIRSSCGTDEIVQSYNDLSFLDHRNDVVASYSNIKFSQDGDKENNQAEASSKEIAFEESLTKKPSSSKKQDGDKENNQAEASSKEIAFEESLTKKPSSSKKQATSWKQTMQKEALTILKTASVLLEQQQKCHAGKEELFCHFLCTELKRIKSEEVLDRLKIKILELTYAAIAEERSKEKTTCALLAMNCNE